MASAELSLNLLLPAPCASMTPLGRGSATWAAALASLHGVWLFTWLGHRAFCAHMVKLRLPCVMAALTAFRANMTCGAGRATCSTAGFTQTCAGAPLTNISIVHVPNMSRDSNACFTPLLGSNHTPIDCSRSEKRVPPVVKSEWGRGHDAVRLHY